MTHARLDSTPRAALPRTDGQAVEWRVSEGLTGYEEAVAAMEARVEQIGRGAAAELVWLVEHPPLYTAGTSAGIGRDDAAHLPSPSPSTRRAAAGRSPIMAPASGWRM